LIGRELRHRFGDGDLHDYVEVLNTHQAQGREWDWVLFSASDTANLPGNAPYFGDSSNRDGRAVLNTTISRAKGHLRVFLDAAWWRERGHRSILAELAGSTEPKNGVVGAP